jgi:hypothetical protein
VIGFNRKLHLSSISAFACEQVKSGAAGWFVRRAKIGGAEGIRTPDLRSAIAALSQLSYGPAAGTNRPNKLPAF